MIPVTSKFEELIIIEGLAAFMKINTDTVTRKSPIPKAIFISLEKRPKKRAIVLRDVGAPRLSFSNMDSERGEMSLSFEPSEWSDCSDRPTVRATQTILKNTSTEVAISAKLCHASASTATLHVAE